MQAPKKDTTALLMPYRHALDEWDDAAGTATLYMRPQPRPCFTHQLLEDIRRFQYAVVDRVRNDIRQHGHSPIRYVVLASGIPGTYSLGGDLNLFVDLIRRRDREGLTAYAVACVDDAYRFSTGLELPLTSIALLQGNAQGGGFEAALSCNVLIAERGTQMGFPEVLFNLFPGMGAYSFLSRRISPTLAERLIFSGDLYSAEELYDMGVIDILAEAGDGERRLQQYIREAGRRTHAVDMLRHVRSRFNNVPYEELIEVTQRWVDAALELTETEMRVMQRLVRAQDRKMTDEERAGDSGSGVETASRAEPLGGRVQGRMDIA